MRNFYIWFVENLVFWNVACDTHTVFVIYVDEISIANVLRIKGKNGINVLRNQTSALFYIFL